MTLYRITRPNGELYAIVPLYTMAEVLHIHDDAVKRVRRETAEKGDCFLYDRFSKPTFVVEPYYGP